MDMEENEVKGRKVAIDIVKANIFAVAIMVVAAIVFLVPFFWIWAGKKPIGELLGGIGCDVEVADSLLPLRRANAYPRLHDGSHDALYHLGCHPCHRCPLHW